MFGFLKITGDVTAVRKSSKRATSNLRGGALLWHRMGMSTAVLNSFIAVAAEKVWESIDGCFQFLRCLILPQPPLTSNISGLFLPSTRNAMGELMAPR